MRQTIFKTSLAFKTSFAVFFLLITAFVFALPAQAADWSKKPFLTVFTSAKTVSNEDSVAITALAATPVGEMADRIQITIDGKTEGCENAYSCRIYAGPFNVAKNTWMKYTVVAIKKRTGSKESGTTRVGYILVKPKAKDTTKPVFTKIITSGNQLSVGDSLDLKILTKDKIGIAKIEIMLDGQLMETCENETECGTIFGPFDENQVGEHKYEFIVTNVSGNSIKPWGKFWVKTIKESGTSGGGGPSTPAESGTSGGGGPATPAQPAEPLQPLIKDDTENPVISISVDKTQASDTDLITFTAKALDNKKIKKINILVNAKEVKVCENAEICSYIGGPYPDYADTSVSYGANAYDEAGNRAWTGYLGVKIIKSTLSTPITPTSTPITPTADSVAPVITVRSGFVGIKTQLNKYGMKISASATDESGKINKIQIFLSEVGVGVNSPISVCPATASPAVCETTYYYISSGKEYIYWVEAFDTSGNRGVSYKYYFKMPEDKPVIPAADITSPSISVEGKFDYILFNLKYYNFVVSALAKDESGKINKIQIFLSEVGAEVGSPRSVCSAAASPAVCTTTYYNASRGKKYTYWAEAFDPSGNKSISTKYYFEVPLK